MVATRGSKASNQGIKIKILPARERKRKVTPSPVKDDLEACKEKKCKPDTPLPSSSSPPPPVLVPYYFDPPREIRRKKPLLTVKNSKPRKDHLASNSCVFCSRSEKDDSQFGPLFTHEKSKISAHLFCMAFSDSISSAYKDPRKGFVGFKISDLRKQVFQGKEQVCDFCFRFGATVTCSYPGCHRIYHLPCGLQKEIKLRFMCQFLTLCDQHDPQTVEKMNPSNAFWSWKDTVPDFEVFFSALQKLVISGVKKQQVLRSKGTDEEARKEQFLSYLELRKNQILFEYVNVLCDEQEMKQFKVQNECAEIFIADLSKVKIESPDIDPLSEENNVSNPIGEERLSQFVPDVSPKSPSPPFSIAITSSDDAFSMPGLSPPFNIQNDLDQDCQSGSTTKEGLNSKEITSVGTLESLLTSNRSLTNDIPSNQNESDKHNFTPLTEKTSEESVNSLLVPVTCTQITSTPAVLTEIQGNQRSSRTSSDPAATVGKQNVISAAEVLSNGSDNVSLAAKEPSFKKPTCNAQTKSMPFPIQKLNSGIPKRVVNILGKTFVSVNGRIQRRSLTSVTMSAPTIWNNNLNPLRVSDLSVEARRIYKL